MNRNKNIFLFGCSLIVAIICLLPAVPAQAATGINQQMNYQARLLDSTGATVPDGTYNIEFKIYQDGTGCVSSGTPPCSGTLKWTETRTGSNRVTVTNGYFSVQLGSVTAFGSSIDWNQDTLWLSLNIGGTAVTPVWDGEMTPFRRLSSSPYALNSGQLGGRSAAEFLQLAPASPQTDSSTASSIAVNKTGGSGNILQLQKAGVNALTVENSGAIGIGAASGLTGTLKVYNSTNSNTVSIQSGTTSSSYTLTLPTALGSSGDCLKDSNGTGQLIFAACGGGTLQQAYDAGNTLTSTNARDIAITLADTATDSNLTVTTASGSTSQTRFILADGAGTTPPAELVLIDMQDTNLTVSNGLTISAATGGVITDGIDVADAEIVNAINIGDNNILTGSATITAAELNLLDGHDVALVDTNDAVSTAIVGTGALNSGSITSGFGSIDTGADNIATTGTVNAGTLSVTNNSTVGGTLGVTGTTTLSGNLVANGDTTIGNATTDRLTVTAQLLGASPLVFQGATDNGFSTTFAITDPTASRTVTFGNETGTVCLQSSTNCGFTTTSQFANAFVQGGNSFGAAAVLGTNDNFGINFEINNATVMNLQTNGSVGVGVTPNADSMLHVYENSAVDSRITIENPNANGSPQLSIKSNVGEWLLGSGGTTTSYAGDFYLYNTADGAFRLYVDGSSGNLGLGTQSPTSALHIDRGTGGAAVQITNAATSGTSTTDGLQLSTDSSLNAYVTNWENMPLYFSTNATVRMGIAANGNVGINTAFGAPTNTLDVNGTVRVRTFGSSTSSTVCRATTGNTGTLSTCSSSERYKEDIKDLSYGLDAVEAMRAVNFKWKDRDERGIGFIAEEMAKVVPEVITYKDGEIEGIDYHLLTAVLAKAIQEQQVQIEKIQDGGVRQRIQQGGEANLSSLNVSGHTKLKSLRVEGDARVQGNLAVKGLTEVADIVVKGHIITAGGAPTSTALPATGGGSVTVDGNDTTGVITITTGNAPSAEDLALVNFHKQFQKKPTVVLTPVGKQSAAISAYIGQTTPAEFILGATNAPEPHQSYTYNYHVMQ